VKKIVQNFAGILTLFGILKTYKKLNYLE